MLILQRQILTTEALRHGENRLQWENLNPSSDNPGLNSHNLLSSQCLRVSAVLSYRCRTKIEERT
jgi:hypothetical protein